MKQACFFMGGLMTLWAYIRFGWTGVFMLGMSDVGLYIAEKVWGE